MTRARSVGRFLESNTSVFPILFNSIGQITVSILSQKTTLTTTCYIKTVSTKRCNPFARSARHLVPEKILLIHDNTSPHNCTKPRSLYLTRTSKLSTSSLTQPTVQAVSDETSDFSRCWSRYWKGGSFHGSRRNCGKPWLQSSYHCPHLGTRLHLKCSGNKWICVARGGEYLRRC